MWLRTTDRGNQACPQVRVQHKNTLTRRRTFLTNVSKLQRLAALASLAHSRTERGHRPMSHPTEVTSQITNPSLLNHTGPPSPSHTTGPRRRPRATNTFPFRIIWGTQGSCSSQVVNKAICALLPRTLWGLIMVKRSEMSAQCGGILACSGIQDFLLTSPVTHQSPFSL